MCCSACSMRLWPSCSRASEELLLSTEPQSAEHFPLLICCQRFLWIYNEDLQSKILLYSTWPCSLFNRECLLAAPNKDVLHELWSQYALQVPLVTPLSKPSLWPYYTYTVYNTLLRLPICCAIRARFQGGSWWQMHRRCLLSPSICKLEPSNWLLHPRCANSGFTRSIFEAHIFRNCTDSSAWRKEQTFSSWQTLVKQKAARAWSDIFPLTHNDVFLNKRVLWTCLQFNSPLSAVTLTGKIKIKVL